MISAADDIAPVLAREVNWDALLASRLVSETDVRLVKSYDKQDADARNAILTEVRAATTPDACGGFYDILGMSDVVCLRKWNCANDHI